MRATLSGKGRQMRDERVQRERGEKSERGSGRKCRKQPTGEKKREKSSTSMCALAPVLNVDFFGKCASRRRLSARGVSSTDLCIRVPAFASVGIAKASLDHVLRFEASTEFRYAFRDICKIAGRFKCIFLLLFLRGVKGQPYKKRRVRNAFVI